MSTGSYFDLLQIPGLCIQRVESGPHSYLIHAEPDFEPEKCPSCDSAMHLRSSYCGRRTYRDTTVHDKKCKVVVRRRSWRCVNKGCHWSHVTPVPGMEPGHSMTERLASRIRRESLSRPFRQVAAEVGCDEALVRELFNDHVARLDKYIHFETPEVMGIDEVRIKGRYMCVITNLHHRTVVEVLELKSHEMLFAYLEGLKDRARVRLISVDMDDLYRSAARRLLPQATVVLDRFHLVARATQAVSKLIDDVRHSPPPWGYTFDDLLKDKWALMKRADRRKPEESKHVKWWTSNFPVLKQACDALQSFYRMWDECKTEAEARTRFGEWQREVKKMSLPEARAAFAPVVKLFVERADDIFSYFASGRLTNAYTEQANRRIRDIDRGGRGHKFRVLRAKILYGNIFKLSPRFERPTRENRGAVSSWEETYEAWLEAGYRRFPARELPRPRLLPVEASRGGSKPRAIDPNQLPLFGGVTDEQLKSLGEQYTNFGVPWSDALDGTEFDEDVA